jgi:hypothetical protein
MFESQNRKGNERSSVADSSINYRKGYPSFRLGSTFSNYRDKMITAENIDTARVLVELPFRDKTNFSTIDPLSVFQGRMNQLPFIKRDFLNTG